MIDKVIEKIEAQQAGNEGTTVFAVGEQLKEICKESEHNAQLVYEDMQGTGMTITDCEAKIKEFADKLHKKHKGKAIGVSPFEADKIIREFYGLGAKAEEPEKAPEINIDDFLG